MADGIVSIPAPMRIAQSACLPQSAARYKLLCGHCVYDLLTRAKQNVFHIFGAEVQNVLPVIIVSASHNNASTNKSYYTISSSGFHAFGGKRLVERIR